MKLKKSVSFLIILLLVFVFSCRKDKPYEEVIPPQTNWTKMPYDTVAVTALNLSGGSTRSLWFFDELHGFLIAVYTKDDYHHRVLLHKTSDGGINWEKVNTVSLGVISSNWNCDVAFLSSTYGLLTWRTESGFEAPNGMQQSSDGGSSWSPTSNVGPHKIFVIDASCAMAGVKTTKDGGTTWQIKSVLEETTDIYFRDTSFGLITTGKGYIARSTNFALSWDTISWDYAVSWEAVTMNGTGTIFAGGTNGIIKSIDEGSSWTHALDGYSITDIAFVDNQIGFATAFDPNTEKGYILKTTDGGNTWVENYHSDFLIPTCLFVANNTTIFAGCRQIYHPDLKYLYFLKTTTQGN